MRNTRLEKEGRMNVDIVNSASLPTVSVIVPAYNVEKYIGECVESLLAQTHPKLEIIVVDDGSTDATASMLGRYEKCGSVKVISQKNQGVSAARNRALAAARGVFVAFIDSDDVVHPELFATCVNLCNGNDGDFVLYDNEEFSSGQIPRFGQISSDRIVSVDAPLSYYLDNGFKAIIGGRIHLQMVTIGNGRARIMLFKTFGVKIQNAISFLRFITALKRKLI